MDPANQSARNARASPAVLSLPRAWPAACTVPIPSDAYSRFLLGNLEQPGRVGAVRRRAFGLRPVPPLPSRPFGFNPSRLRTCGAARFACLQGISARPIPAARSVAPLEYCRTGAAGSAWPAPRRNGRGAADTPWFAAAGCVKACRPQRWRFEPITSRSTVHEKPAQHRNGVFTPRFKTGTARCGRGVLACRRAIDLASVRKPDGAAYVRGCRVVPVSFRREIRPKASLSRCESWRWRGYASGFMAATVRRKQFPLRCAHSSR
jgi:hypothetical protein